MRCFLYYIGCMVGACAISDSMCHGVVSPNRAMCASNIIFLFVNDSLRNKTIIVMVVRREGDFTPGADVPRPVYHPQVQLGQSPLHKRLLHPKMKRRVSTGADDDKGNGVMPAVTLRSARQLQYFSNHNLLPTGAFDATFVGGDDDDDNDDGSFADTQSSPAEKAALLVPTAEEVFGAQATSPTDGRFQKLFLPHTYDAWGGNKHHAQGGVPRPSTASVRRLPRNDARAGDHSARLYHRDFIPTADDFVKATAAQSARHRAAPPLYTLRPFHSSVPSTIPPYDAQDPRHAELLRETERDNVCRSIQREEEHKLQIKARITQTHEPTPPERSAQFPHGTFPISLRLARMQRRLKDIASPRVVKEFVTPTFVLPSSRRYGSNKYREAPGAQMAYELDEDEVESHVALTKFERMHPRAM